MHSYETELSDSFEKRYLTQAMIEFIYSADHPFTDIGEKLCSEMYSKGCFSSTQYDMAISSDYYKFIIMALFLTLFLVKGLKIECPILISFPKYSM